MRSQAIAVSLFALVLLATACTPQKDPITDLNRLIVSTDKIDADAVAHKAGTDNGHLVDPFDFFHNWFLSIKSRQ